MSGDLTGGRRIELERRRQIALGFNTQHDIEEHSIYDLLDAAVGYIWPTRVGIWPESMGMHKPSEDRVHDLEKAGAFIAAAIDYINAQKDKND